MPIHRPGQVIKETPTHTLTLPLKIEPWQARDLDKTFEAARLLYNSLTSYFLKQHKLYINSRQYRISTEIMNSKTLTSSQRFRAQKTLKQLKVKFGFTRADFERKSSELCTGWLSSRLYSMVRQRIANICFSAFSALLSGKGKMVKFKRKSDIEATLCNKWNNGPFRYENGSFICGNSSIPVTIPHDNPYVSECLRHRVKFCSVTRKIIRSKIKYYLILYLEGIAPVKVTNYGELKHPVSFGDEVGIDIGTQTIALSSKNGVWGGVLASEIGDVQVIQNKIRKLNRAMDRSRRATNPWTFDKNGCVIGKDKIDSVHIDCFEKRKWKISKHYKILQARRKELYRKQAFIRKQSHYLLIQRILSLGTIIHVEKMNFKALTKRASGAPKKSKKTGKFLSKKRFGKSIANRAPAMLIEMLRLKVEALGGKLYKSNAYKIKASQIDHQTKFYTKKKLSERYHILQDGTKIQRDYYSAFIEQHVDEENNVVNFEKCTQDFPAFYEMYKADMNRLIAYQGYLPKSFGIKK